MAWRMLITLLISWVGRRWCLALVGKWPIGEINCLRLCRAMQAV